MNAFTADNLRTVGVGEGSEPSDFRKLVETQFAVAYGEYRTAVRERRSDDVLKARARMNYLVKVLLHPGQMVIQEIDHEQTG